MSEMATRRVLKRGVAPAKITIVDGGKGGRDADASSNKENLVNCSLYTLFENHYQKSKDGSLTAGQPQINKATRLKGSPGKSIPQSRKRPLSNRLSDRSAVAPEQESRELSPPVLTTSDTFQPAKRTLPASATTKSDGMQNDLPKVKTPVLETTESCDVLVASPKNVKKAQTTPEREQQRLKSTPGARKDFSRRTPSSGRRLSVLRLSIAREGGAPLSNSRADASSSIKKQSPAKVGFTNGSRTSCLNGKGMVFSAIKRTVSVDATPSGVCLTDPAKSHGKATERRKSIGEGTGRYGSKSGNVKRNVVEKPGSGDAALPQATSASTSAKAMAESIRTRKLSMVLKNEQRLAEKNEQYGVKLRQLQAELEERDHEAERLRTAALMLNNMINRQAEENRDLQLKLKEALNENVQVRNICEKLDRELRKARETLRLQVVPAKQCETKDLTALTSGLNGLAIQRTPAGMVARRAEERTDSSESGADPNIAGSHAKESPISEELQNVDGQSVPTIDDAEQCTLEDLQDMVMQEESLLKKRCANALEELNLPFATLLTTRGSLDVNSLKKILAQISLTDENLTPERKSSIRKLSAWIGSV